VTIGCQHSQHLGYRGNKSSLRWRWILWTYSL